MCVGKIASGLGSVAGLSFGAAGLLLEGWQVSAGSIENETGLQDLKSATVHQTDETARAET